MKKIILVFVCMLCIVAPNAKNQVKDQTRVMVISDPHLLTTENADKLTANKGGKLDKISPTIFAKAVETIVKAKPEALLVCGDMTFNGEASGHSQMVAALADIEAEGIPVLVIPGNHDIQNPYSEDANGANVTPDQFKTLYGAFGMGKDSHLENISRDAQSLSWAGSLKGTNLAIIGLDANIYGTTPTYYSDGCLRKSTIDWMTAQAAALRDKGKMVVCMVHHQLIEHVVGQSILAQSTLLNMKYTKHPVDGTDEDAVTNTDLLKAFADAQIQYVLTGHFHIHHTQNKTVKNSEGEDFTLTELTTGGLSTYPNWMRTLVFDTPNNQLASSTSTMIQTKVGEEDLQTISKDELTTWANTNYGSTIAAGIAMMNSDVDQYEIYDGTTQFQLEESAYPEVLYTRNFSDNNWQTLYVPFDMQYADWSGICEIAKFHSANDESLRFTLLKEGDLLEKNTPALIRLKDELPTGQYTITSSIKDSDKTSVMPVEGQSSPQTGFTLRGTYAGLTGSFMYKNKCLSLSSGQFTTVGNDAKGNAGIFLQPQRWYLTEASGNTPAFKLSVESETTKNGTTAAQNLEQKNSKYFVDGQLIIVKGDKLFNAKGQEVK